MLVPAILKKQELERKFAEHIYDADMFYINTYPYANNIFVCAEGENNDGWFYYAIMNKETVIGYLSYWVDSHTDSVTRFALYSFDKGNYIVGKDMFEKMEELIARHHRVEWKMIVGNPVQRSYDRYCEKHGGNKVVLHDVCKDADGIYHDEIIYEIVKKGE